MTTNCLLSQSNKTINDWYEIAVSKLVKSGLVAFTDELWANQSYVEKVMLTAQELYSDSLVSIND